MLAHTICNESLYSFCSLRFRCDSSNTRKVGNLENRARVFHTQRSCTLRTESPKVWDVKCKSFLYPQSVFCNRHPSILPSVLLRSGLFVVRVRGSRKAFPLLSHLFACVKLEFSIQRFWFSKGNPPAEAQYSRSEHWSHGHLRDNWTQCKLPQNEQAHTYTHHIRWPYVSTTYSRSGLYRLG